MWWGDHSVSAEEIAARKGLRAPYLRELWQRLDCYQNLVVECKQLAASGESGTIRGWPASESVWHGQAILLRWLSCVINFAQKPVPQRKLNRGLSEDVHPG